MKPRAVPDAHTGAARVAQAMRAVGWVAVGAAALWVNRRRRRSAVPPSASPVVRATHAPSLLLVGDSTALGVGASDARLSLAGRLAGALPMAQIVNRGMAGATLASMRGQLHDDDRFDAILIVGGGNDVLNGTPPEALRQSLWALIRLARERADLVVVLPCGNLGSAPRHSIWRRWPLSRRSRRLQELAREGALALGAGFVSIYRQRRRDPFAHERGLHAADGIHPSDAGYGYWFDMLVRQADLVRRLAQSAPPPVRRAGAGASPPGRVAPA